VVDCQLLGYYMGLRELWLRFVLRPLGLLLGLDRWEPHVVGACHCLSCGDEYVVVLAADDPCYDAETGVIDMLECRTCGESTVCSD
jgi:hypothetical protein